jgi:uncharacterized membrane-anchored protein
VGLAVVAGLYVWTNMSRVLLFWAAFILTRPFGATVGDFLDKPMNQGGLAISRPLASAVIAAAGRSASRAIRASAASLNFGASVKTGKE